MTIRSLWRERDNQLLILLASAPLLYMLYFYAGSVGITPWLATQPADSLARVGHSRVVALLALGIIPMLIIRLLLRQRLSDFGLKPRGLRFNLWFIVVGACVAVLATYISSRSPEFRAVYPEVRSAIGVPRVFAAASAFYLLYYVGYEVFFRGYLLFGVEQRLGSWPAILVSTLGTSLVHITRPVGEYMSAVVFGFVFGYVALRTRSIWGVFVVHVIAGLSMDFFCGFR